MRWLAHFGVAALVLTGAGWGTVARAQTADPEPEARPAREERLQPYSRIDIIRHVSGEFARAVRPLPSDRKGFRVQVGQPVDEQALGQALANHGSGGSPGDVVQVTKIEFRNREIWVDINGGAKQRRRFRDRLQVSVGGVGTVQQQQMPGYQARGSTLVLDFGRPLPDMGPEELKELLADFLDFGHGPSATVNWVETLPEEFQEAIREQRAVVGMSRDMVIAALGRPPRRVRERAPDGTDNKDWIYGNPPGPTVFVKFAGDVVIDVREFP
jgi:hypothetical protein